MKRSIIILLVLIVLGASACHVYKASPSEATSALDANKTQDISKPEDPITTEQVIEIVEKLAAYHADQFTDTAEIGTLSLSETVVSELAERQICINEMAKRINATFVHTDSEVRIDQIEETEKGFIVYFYETTYISYRYSGSSGNDTMGQGIDHCTVIDFNGTVVSDAYGEWDTTGFSNIARDIDD